MQKNAEKCKKMRSACCEETELNSAAEVRAGNSAGRRGRAVPKWECKGERLVAKEGRTKLRPENTQIYIINQ